MTQKSTSRFLDESIEMLVRYFGIHRVQSALAKVRNSTVAASDGPPRRRPAKPNDNAKPSVSGMLAQLQQIDEEKHRLLTNFYAHLKDGKVLPEPQDIHHYAQIIGLKEITGKSRKEMIPRLIRFLLEQPPQRLRADLEAAASISEEQRQKGFSVLTDKLLGGGKEKKGAPS